MRQIYRIVPACALLVFLSGCATTSIPVSVSQHARAQNQAMGLPPRNPSGKQALLYVMTDTNFAYVADYPSGASLHKVETEPDVEGTGICSDANGHVFITGYVKGTSFTGYAFEFAHGGASPISTLSFAGTPTSCSVDTTTGNLAITSTARGNCDSSTVDIFPRATRTPTTYDVPGFACLTGAAYDAQGDLFVGGSGGGYAIAELPRGSTDFAGISLNQQIKCAQNECHATLQWDGDDLAVIKPTVAHASPIVYRVQISGSLGTIVGTTTFHGNFNGYSGGGAQIYGNKMILTYRANTVGQWSYPAGGKMLKVLKGFKGFYHPGLTVSL